jgi:hypothetical protein
MAVRETCEYVQWTLGFQVFMFCSSKSSEFTKFVKKEGDNGMLVIFFHCIGTGSA